jgi:hypothetical protein
MELKVGNKYYFLDTQVHYTHPHLLAYGTEVVMTKIDGSEYYFTTPQGVGMVVHPDLFGEHTQENLEKIQKRNQLESQIYKLKMEIRGIENSIQKYCYESTQE